MAAWAAPGTVAHARLTHIPTRSSHRSRGARGGGLDRPGAPRPRQRYASPTGSGTPAPPPPPAIRQAVGGAKAGDEVIVTTGDYTLRTPRADQLTIHGVAGQPRPRLHFRAPGQGGSSTDPTSATWRSSSRAGARTLVAISLRSTR